MGTFDGQNHILSNFGVKGQPVGDNYYCGLFDNIRTIKNLTVNNFSLNIDKKSSGKYSNIYAGCFQAKADSITISHCHINYLAINANGQVAATNTFLGNFVGQANIDTTTYCTFLGFVNDSIPISSSTICYGGIIGQIDKYSNNTYRYGIISNCTISYNKPLTIVATSSANVGGAIGKNTSNSSPNNTTIKISACSFALNNNITGTIVYAAGAIGSTWNASHITIENDNVSGTINATYTDTINSRLAAWIGKYRNINSSKNIRNCNYDSLEIYGNGTKITEVREYNE